MNAVYLDFEKQVKEFNARIAELENMDQSPDGPSIKEEIQKLRQKSERQLVELYQNLTPWRKTQVARHASRPHFTDYLDSLIKDYQPLAGDRTFGNDQAILGGLGTIFDQSVVVIGQEKGRTTQNRVKHNFGMARPEGYRKAIRLMDMADKFKLPVVSFVDTPGAYPGKTSEERGQAEAIARSTERCLTLQVPMISLIIGEGGSGGAIAIAAANRVLMLEHSIYSVISPEGCASILYRDSTKAKDAAEAMKITAGDLLRLKVVDKIVKEPVGGAHRDQQLAIATAGKAIADALKELEPLSPQELIMQRRERFYAIGREGL